MVVGRHDVVVEEEGSAQHDVVVEEEGSAERGVVVVGRCGGVVVGTVVRDGCDGRGPFAWK